MREEENMEDSSERWQRRREFSVDQSDHHSKNTKGISTVVDEKFSWKKTMNIRILMSMFMS